VREGELTDFAHLCMVWQFTSTHAPSTLISLPSSCIEMSAAAGAASDNAPPAPAAVAAPPEIHLDGRAWTSPSDFYNAFLPAVHAPSWHTRSLDALNDSLLTGGINGLESFTLILRAPKQWPRNMRDFMTTLGHIFDQTEALQGANAGKRSMRIVRDDEQSQ